MGGAVSSGNNNDQLVDNLVQAHYIKTPAVEHVFRAVDRAFYYTDEDKASAYKDLAWKKRNLHLSAPCIYSQVMECLELKEGLSFLNIGSGTGYLSTMVGLILGSRGMNHGLEIHPDVIEYAEEKLQAFIAMNSAVDEYEFCEPQFQLGNCLSLGSTERLYDRIYCGAACPEIYSNVIRQLLAVGGILVMPVNDQLLQMKRIDDKSWEVKSVLPVSFASLVVPPEDLSDDAQATLPSINPQSLQSLCRYEIRSILRDRVHKEHPNLWFRNRRHPKEIKRSVEISRCIIPLLADSDSDDSIVDIEEEDNRLQEELDETSSSSEDFSVNENVEQDLELTNGRVGVRLADTLSDGNVQVGGKSKTKREKIDSGVSELFELSSDVSQSFDQSPTPKFSPSSPSTSKTNSTATSNSASDDCTLEASLTSNGMCPPPDDEGSQSALADFRDFTHSVSGEGEGTALVLLERSSEDEHTLLDSSDENDSTNDLPNQQNDFAHMIRPPQDYSFYLKRSLMALPLPFPLKLFLNYGRKF